MFDIIGDIHGHANELEVLLKRLGYQPHQSGYRHSERKALFVGDYVDRGPKIRRTLEIVRTMVENDQAIALMGNHEFNAICFNMRDSKSGKPLRPHTAKNIQQHAATLKQFENDRNAYEDYIQWFKKLPLFYENKDFRAVHATWRQDLIEAFLKENGGTSFKSEQHIINALKGNQTQQQFAEVLLKGEELKLKDGVFFHDKDGHKRNHIRIKWWLDPMQTSWKAYSIIDLPELSNELVKQKVSFYPSHEKPVFFGHYWLKGKPELQAKNVCCVDYSVAKGGSLVAYRYAGDDLLKEHFYVV